MEVRTTVVMCCLLCVMPGIIIQEIRFPRNYQSLFQNHFLKKSFCYGNCSEARAPDGNSHCRETLAIKQEQNGWKL